MERHHITPPEKGDIVCIYYAGSCQKLMYSIESISFSKAFCDQCKMKTEEGYLCDACDGDGYVLVRHCLIRIDPNLHPLCHFDRSNC
jgi:hypothetical protein